MTKRSKADDFLRAMSPDPAETAGASIVRENSARRKEQPSTRVGLKHIGGYLDRETVEKIAVLRARLDLDNSELIKLAIDELHRKHNARRAFGDA
jgi:hypothetical protein